LHREGGEHEIERMGGRDGGLEGKVEVGNMTASSSEYCSVNVYVLCAPLRAICPSVLVIV